MPCPGGWRNAAVPAQAVRLREPLWCRPLGPQAAADQGWPGLPPLAPDLQLVALRPAARRTEALLAVQNNGPCRRQLEMGPHWQVLARCDGLERDLDGDQPDGPALTALAPWQLGFWRLKLNPRGRQTDR